MIWWTDHLGFTALCVGRPPNSLGYSTHGELQTLHFSWRGNCNSGVSVWDATELPCLTWGKSGFEKIHYSNWFKGMEGNRKLGDANGSWKKGRFLARREKKLGTVWKKWFGREIMENVTGRRTGTQRPYVKFLEKKIPERWLTNVGWEGRNQDTTGRLCKRWSLLEDCQMRKSEGAVALLQSHLTEWTVWIPSIP